MRLPRDDQITKNVVTKVQPETFSQEHGQQEATQEYGFKEVNQEPFPNPWLHIS